MVYSDIYRIPKELTSLLLLDRKSVSKAVNVGREDVGNATKRSDTKPHRRELTYTWDHTPELLQEYFDVRQYSYAQHLGLRKFSGKLDWQDLNSDILLVIDKNKCVGGLRLTVQCREVTPYLPIEDDDFRLKELFPELDLDNCKYAEISRLALLPAYRSGHQTASIYSLVAKKMDETKIKHFFTVSPLLQAKRVQRIARLLGYEATIFKDIKLPEKNVYEGLEMVISVLTSPKI
jgi:hypothetical protein